jgi:hypothetical protein
MSTPTVSLLLNFRRARARNLVRSGGTSPWPMMYVWVTSDSTEHAVQRRV